jgi:hypothetical protein
MSPIDICNQALAHLGDRRITRLDAAAQAGDALVRYCSEFYDQARQEVLAAHRWTFAKHAVPLSRRTDVTTIGFTYAHDLPYDHIRLLRVVPGETLLNSAGVLTSVTYTDNTIDSFKIVGSKVWSDYSYVAAEYVRDVENPSEWTPHFRAAVARLLASYLAGPTSDNPNEVISQKRAYESIDLPNAQFYDAVQDKSGENSDQATRLAGSPTLLSRYN